MTESALGRSRSGIPAGIRRSILRSMTVTTIKVPTELREQIADLARARGTTQASVIEAAIEALLRRERLEAARRAMQPPLPEDYAAEARDWQELSARSVRRAP